VWCTAQSRRTRLGIHPLAQSCRISPRDRVCVCAREKDRAIERARATEREGEQEAEDGERERDSRESKEDGSRAKDRAKQADAPWHPARGLSLAPSSASGSLFFCVSPSLPLYVSLSLSHTHTHSLSVSLSLSHTHTLIPRTVGGRALASSPWPRAVASPHPPTAPPCAPHTTPGGMGVVCWGLEVVCWNFGGRMLGFGGSYVPVSPTHHACRV
jgi:hypothetical protein